MPRKRWNHKVTIYGPPPIDSTNRHANSDEEHVRHALVDFDELTTMSASIRDQLVNDLVDAVRFARAGIEARKVGVSNKAITQQVFVADIGRAMERAGLHPTRWRKQYDSGSGESLYFRFAREIAGVSGIDPLPKDPKLLGQLASQYRYNYAAPAMATQDPEVDAGPEAGGGSGPRTAGA